MAECSAGWARRALGIGLTLAASAVQAITGTWVGEMVGSDGSQVTMSYTFSPAGGLFVQLPGGQGVRDVELRHAGQAEQWMAPGGAVAQGRVLALSADAQHFQARVRMSSGSSPLDGVLKQTQVDLALDFRLVGGVLQAVVQQSTSTTLSGGPYPPTPTREFTLYQGRLLPQR